MNKFLIKYINIAQTKINIDYYLTFQYTNNLKNKIKSDYQIIPENYRKSNNMSKSNNKSDKSDKKIRYRRNLYLKRRRECALSVTLI